MIEGFTDSTGSENYNQKLSEERAQAVHLALQNMGISANRMTLPGLWRILSGGGQQHVGGPAVKPRAWNWSSPKTVARSRRARRACIDAVLAASNGLSRIGRW